MPDYNLGSVAVRAFDLVQDIPSDISGSLPNIAYNAMLYVNSVLRLSIGSQTISEAHFGLITNLTSAMALSRMQNIGVDFNWNLGEFSVSKGAGSGASEQMSFLLGMVNAEIRGIGRRTIIRKSNG